MTTLDTETMDKLLRRARTRRKSGERAVVIFLTNSMLLFLNSWLLMLAIGIAHAHWLPQLPTIGYWWTVLLLWMTRGTFAYVRARDLKLDDFLDGK